MGLAEMGVDAPPPLEASAPSAMPGGQKSPVGILTTKQEHGGVTSPTTPTTPTTPRTRRRARRHIPPALRLTFAAMGFGTGWTAVDSIFQELNKYIER
jgi:hypothetical protein